MPRIVAILGLLLGLAFTASPAAAHVVDAPTVDGMHVDTAANAAVVHDHGHDHAEHHEEGLAHSHGPGEDIYHQKASHCSLDVAHVQKPSALPRVAGAYLQTAALHETVHGITVAPPVPPPLG